MKKAILNGNVFAAISDGHLVLENRIRRLITNGYIDESTAKLLRAAYVDVNTAPLLKSDLEISLSHHMFQDASGSYNVVLNSKGIIPGTKQKVELTAFTGDEATFTRVLVHELGHNLYDYAPLHIQEAIQNLYFKFKTDQTFQKRFLSEYFKFTKGQETFGFSYEISSVKEFSAALSELSFIPAAKKVMGDTIWQRLRYEINNAFIKIYNILTQSGLENTREGKYIYTLARAMQGDNSLTPTDIRKGLKWAEKVGKETPLGKQYYKARELAKVESEISIDFMGQLKQAVLKSIKESLKITEDFDIEYHALSRLLSEASADIMFGFRGIDTLLSTRDTSYSFLLHLTDLLQQNPEEFLMTHSFLKKGNLTKIADDLQAALEKGSMSSSLSRFEKDFDIYSFIDSLRRLDKHPFLDLDFNGSETLNYLARRIP